jgi:hypothetical protein
VERLFRILRPDQCLRIRYEDLCRDTEGRLAEIVRFVGLTPVNGPIRFRETEHHIIGNRMRLSGSSQVVLDEVWRTRLDADQIYQTVHWTRRFRRLYGYSNGCEYGWPSRLVTAPRRKLSLLRPV